MLEGFVEVPLAYNFLGGFLGALGFLGGERMFFTT